MEKRLKNQNSQKDFRQELRNNLTPAEAALWALIKGKQLAGKKFRRQFGIDRYVLDFYCPEEKLAIELDGQSHEDIMVQKKDFERDAFLEGLGIKILRFENKLVFANQEYVIAEILSHFREQ